MASRRPARARARDEEPDDDRRGGRRRQPKNSMAPLFAFLAIAAAGIVVAGYAFSKKDSSKAAPRLVGEDGGAPSTTKEAQDPFDGHVPAPPPRRGYTKLLDKAPPGLAETPIFVAAQQLAAQGYTEAKLADAALKAGDNPTYSVHGVAALAHFDSAVEKIADWEMECQLLYNEGELVDRQMKAISKEISDWHKMRGKYRKASMAGK
jgi:hypothetical protein